MNYRAIFEYLGAASIVIGQDDVILLANRKFEEFSGCTRDEIEGKKNGRNSWLRMIGPKSRGVCGDRKRLPIK